MNNFFKILIFIIFIVPAARTAIFAEEKPSVFSTWEGFEPDKCAAIWLIKRFINKDAEIKFFKKSSMIAEGIPFDTPDAKFRRYHNMSTFESMLKHYKLNDPKLVYIGKIIHDIEINIWGRKLLDETQKVKEDIVQMIMKQKNNESMIQESLSYFDMLYENSPK